MNKADFNNVRHVSAVPQFRRPVDQKYLALVGHARVAPGEWFAVDYSTRPNVSNIKGGIPKAFAPAGSFDAHCVVSGTTEEPIYTLYVKYLGVSE